MTREDFPLSFAVCERFAAQIVQMAKSKVRNASGKLANSLSAVVSSDMSRIDIYGEDYGIPVDQGRSPGKMPPLASIRTWAQIKGIDERAAFPIARKIAKEGIAATHFLTETIEMLEDQFLADLADAMVKDIENQFPDETTGE